MMRKIYIFVLVCFLAVSCAQDEGNYIYRELDEPVITGIGDVESLTYERLMISPDLGENALPDEAYSFEWKAIDRNNQHEQTVIGENRNLDYEVLLAPGLYSLYFTVTEKDTGLYWSEVVSLTVSSSMSEGWMVLCSDEGRARLDVVSAVTGEIYRDILADNGTPTYMGPRRIQWLSDKTDASSPYYLLTDDGATRLGKDDFGWKPEYDFAYEVAVPEKLIPHSIVSSGFGKVIVSGSKAHYCEIMGFDGLYGSAVNKNFGVAPYVGSNALATQVYASVYLLYDMDRGRFMAYCPLLSSSDLGGLDPVADMDEFTQIAQGMAPDAGVVGNAFDEWPEGMELVYMENTRYDPGNGKMGMTYALLEDGAGHHVYGMQLGDILRYADCTYVLGKGYFGDVSSCRSIASEDNLYAFSSLKNYMYYASGSIVYRVDLSEKPLKAVEQFRLSGETVTCLKFNLYQRSENMQKSYDLIVGSVRDGKGKVRIYEGRESDGDFSNVTPVVYDGFAEVVDVTYKERIY